MRQDSMLLTPFLESNKKAHWESSRKNGASFNPPTKGFSLRARLHYARCSVQHCFARGRSSDTF
eukprot:6187258-Pleurochrysis_carterae.AAC.1